ncbi:hypothetical protein EVAR_26541_1 [Eumeta japonica]|uniref:Uncharacterized protein n=1 Tax=Eumeta variegata TaxID=151549 RepID=A0A4C1YN89_EUMVA|nr:hypothetical protein EVAR_26541_1 [Eumeta japonica]
MLEIFRSRGYGWRVAATIGMPMVRAIYVCGGPRACVHVRARAYVRACLCVRRVRMRVRPYAAHLRPDDNILGPHWTGGSGPLPRHALMEETEPLVIDMINAKKVARDLRTK